MTTPPTTAGWYPDPDGSGGQRYWDGAAWSDHGPDATETSASTEETSAWPSELPPWPEDMTMPSWDEAGKAEPVSEVETPEPDAAPEPEEPVVDEVEPAPAEEPEVSADQPTTVVELVEFVEFVEQDQPTAVVPLPEPPTAAVPTPPTEPVAFATTAPQTESGSSGPLKGYLIGVGGLLAVLVAVLVWAFAFADPGTESAEATGADETSETAGTTAPATDSTDPTGTTEGEVIGVGGQVSDGDVAITSNGVEITPTVSAADNEMLTKTASGEFVVVRLTLLNNGELPATFLADQQVLNAGGQTFNTETESTFYLGGISAVLYPGQPVDVAFAYDVPPGTAPESLEVHGDLASPGAVLPLS